MKSKNLSHRIKIDSLKLMFPKESVIIVDDKFNAEYSKVFLHSGEVEQHVNLDKHKVEKIHGISSRIAMAYWMQGDQSSAEVFYVQINAKMLRERYFEGITFENHHLVYDHIMNQKIIYIDERTWLNGVFSDVDFCYDFEAPPKRLVEVNNHVFRHVRPNMFKYVDQPFKQLKKGNVGIQFNRRERATPARPFTKIYHKGLELKSKSSDFASKFLTKINFDNFARLEVTLKNSRDKKYFNMSRTKTFKDLLELEEEKREEIIFSALPKYLEKQKRKEITEDVLPFDRYILWVMSLLVDRGYGKAALFQGLDLFENKDQKHRVRKKLERLIGELPDQNKLESNMKIDDILQQLRIF